MCGGYGEDYIDVPVLGAQNYIYALAPFGRKPEVKTIRISIPIERTRLYLKVIMITFLIFTSGLIMFVFLAPILYSHITSVVGSVCTTRGGKFISGYVCAMPWCWGLLLTGAVILVSGLSCFGYALEYRRVGRSPGPHLRVTQDSFWCQQLTEPIRFADVLDANFDRSPSPLARSSTQAVTFTLRRPPALAYGKGEKVMTWRGEFPCFRFSTLAYSDNEGLAQAIGFLVERYKKDHPDPSHISL
jgi:hypothetical protein